MERTKLHVDGMVCGHCEIAVQDAVRKLHGIKKVKTSKRKEEAEDKPPIPFYWLEQAELGPSHLSPTISAIHKIF